jgi:hypothetical protein
MNDYEIKLADDEIEQKLHDFEGWLCVCGQFNEHEFHCDNCKSEPPWGCDCDFCNEPDYEDDWYDEEEHYTCSCRYCICLNETEYGEVCSDCRQGAHQG